MAQPFEITWWTIDGGGGTSSGGGFTLSGTIGQPDAAGPLVGGSFELTPGFWAGVGAGNAGCPADLTGDGVLDVFDVFVFLADYDNGVCSGPNGDFNGDGVCDVFDVFAYLGAYDNGNGCP